MGITAIGVTAGVLTTLSFLPQVLHSARRRSAAGFSWLWLLGFGGGVSAWIAYGVGRGDAEIIWPNAITLLAILVLVWLRVASGRAIAESPPAAKGEGASTPAVALTAASTLDRDLRG